MPHKDHAKRLEYMKEYNSRPEIKERRKIWSRTRLQKRVNEENSISQKNYSEMDIIAGNCEEVEMMFKAEPPITEVKNGYGFYGVVLRHKTHDKIQCHVCGRWFANLCSHVIRKHGYESLEYYKKEFGIPLNFPLTSRELSRKRSKVMTETHRNNPTRKAHLKKAYTSRTKKSWKHAKYGRSCAAFQNKFGICKDQVLNRYLVACEVAGETISQNKLRKVDPPLMGVIQRRYKSLNAFRKAHNIDIPCKPPVRWTEATIVGAIRKVFIKTKSIPKPRDFGNNRYSKKMFEDLPYYQSIISAFGSFNRALVIAGII